ncbi:hypothetical protein [Saccharomonospora piscinae]|uniref:hypothetical protein n=1 Tax=Saccharomonospora piscinae TaxID=687388 RepID=UPI0012DE4299|nr:hypothetical protein [Saccharomonospora piscinae]
MKTKLRARVATVLSGALLLLATGAGSAAAAEPSASGESGEVTAAATCYGGAVQWTHTSSSPLRVPSSGNYTASSRCNDINIRTTRWSGWAEGYRARVCFYPSWGDRYCGASKPVPSLASGWTVLATDVLDGTKFHVELRKSGGNARVGGELAF